MLASSITYFGEKCLLACDAKCNKAWGVPSRPYVQLGEEPDDVLYMSDSELGEAPIDPGTYEGGYGKPQSLEYRHNKWCARSCERSIITKLAQGDEVAEDFELPDWSKSVRNMP